jgi:hypothetical protein
MRVGGKWVFIDFGMAKKSDDNINDFNMLIIMLMEFVTEAYGEDIFSDMTLEKMFPGLMSRVGRSNYSTMETLYR